MAYDDTLDCNPLQSLERIFKSLCIGNMNNLKIIMSEMFNMMLHSCNELDKLGNTFDGSSSPIRGSETLNDPPMDIFSILKSKLHELCTYT